MPVGVGGHALHTIVQINKGFHIVFLYGSEEKKVSVVPTIYAVNAQDFLKFMEENEKYLIKESTGMGFGGVGLQMTEIGRGDEE